MLCRPFSGTEYQDRAVGVGVKVFKTRLSHIALENSDAVDVTAMFLRALAQGSVLEETLIAGSKAHHRQRRSGFHGTADLAQSEDRVGEMVQRSCRWRRRTGPPETAAPPP